MLIVEDPFIWHRTFSALPPESGGDILILAGARVERAEHEELWLAPEFFGAYTIEHSDVKWHGCVVQPENVIEVEDTIKDLGWVNGWKTEPPEYVEHMANAVNHLTSGRSIGRCMSETVCHRCRISWKVDSSD